MKLLGFLLGAIGCMLISTTTYSKVFKSASNVKTYCKVKIPPKSNGKSKCYAEKGSLKVYMACYHGSIATFVTCALKRHPTYTTKLVCYYKGKVHRSYPQYYLCSQR